MLENWGEQHSKDGMRAIGRDKKGVIRGDGKSASIAAASIVAKVFRDHWMRQLHELYPAYAFHNHKGYGTAEHLRALQEKGPSPVHRRSFAPVRAVSGRAVL